jgi:hypothetical protein
MTPRRARIGRPVRFPVDCYLRRYLFAGSSCLKIQYVIDFIGGRTRTRTLDPLIKSQLASLKYQRLTTKPLTFSSITDQTVTHEMQTAGNRRDPQVIGNSENPRSIGVDNLGCGFVRLAFYVALRAATGRIDGFQRKPSFRWLSIAALAHSSAVAWSG